LVIFEGSNIRFLLNYDTKKLERGKRRERERKVRGRKREGKERERGR